MTVTRLYNGAWRCSAVHAGHLVERTYYGYRKREAVAAFRRELRHL